MRVNLSIKGNIKKDPVITVDAMKGNIIVNGTTININSGYGSTRDIPKESLLDWDKLTKVEKDISLNAIDIADYYDKDFDEIQNIIVDDDDEVIGVNFFGSTEFFPSEEFIEDIKNLEDEIKKTAPKDDFFKKLMNEQSISIEDYKRILGVKIKNNKKHLSREKQIKMERNQSAARQKKEINKNKKNIEKTKLKDEYKKIKEKAEKLVDIEVEKLRAQIKSNSQGIRQVKLRHNKGKGSINDKVSSLKKVGNNYVKPATVSEIRNLSNIFEPENLIGFEFKQVKKAQLIIPGHKYNIPPIKKEKSGSNLQNFLLEKNMEEQKLIFALWYGCYVAATYFQILVSNTPIDEPYQFEKEVIRKDRLKVYESNKKFKDIDKIASDANVRIEKVTVDHKPDNKYVRGDWYLVFRGKKFKAFETELEEGSNYVAPDFTFEEKLFSKKSDQNSIYTIADQLYLSTKDGDDLSSAFNTFNINPRCQTLESGGYSNKSSAKTGSKYGFKHGVTNTKLTYQAPHGFIAITAALWNATVSSGRWPGTVIGFVNSKKNKLDVSDKNNKVFKELLDKYPTLKKTSGKLRSLYK